MALEADFLAAIYAEAGDDARRRVYSDWLLEQPEAQLRERGEFIALQFLREERDLASEEEAREAEIYARHAERWLGPLAPVVAHDDASWDFARGFFDRATLESTTPGPLRAVLGAREWATVRVIYTPLDANIALRRAHAELIVQPQLGQLRDIDIGEETLYALADHRGALPVERMQLRARYLVDEGYRATVAACTSLPELRDLFLQVDDATGSVQEDMPWGPCELEWLLDAPLGRGLRRLRFGHGYRHLRAWCELLGRRPTQLDELAFDRARRWNDRVLLSRSESGGFTVLRFTFDHRPVDDEPERERALLEALALAPDDLVELTVEGAVAGPFRRRIDEASRRFRRLERLEIG
jgi:uncharacterized protein (TIGR02996 family)